MKKVFCILFSCVMICSLIPTLSYSVSADTSSGKKLIALTFDDGPHPRYTNQILDILKEYGVRATFFEVGENVRYYSETAQRVAREGHEIGNHTNTHPHLKGIDSASLRREVELCDNAIESVTGKKTKIFRPPEGVVEECVKVMAQDKNYSLVLWDIDTKDWAGTDSRVIVKNVLDNAKNGSIILMHDYLSKKCHTLEALRVIVPELIRRGYTFVTVSEMVGKK